jgi:hypothetical protein
LFKRLIQLAFPAGTPLAKKPVVSTIDFVLDHRLDIPVEAQAGTVIFRPVNEEIWDHKTDLLDHTTMGHGTQSVRMREFLRLPAKRNALKSCLASLEGKPALFQ